MGGSIEEISSEPEFSKMSLEEAADTVIVAMVDAILGGLPQFLESELEKVKDKILIRYPNKTIGLFAKPKSGIYFVVGKKDYIELLQNKWRHISMIYP